MSAHHHSLSAGLTLEHFFAEIYRPTYLADARPATLRYYAGALRHWKRLTDDPPLMKIDLAQLAAFRTALRVGRSAATVNSIMRAIQALLNKAGPPGYKNRDAAGILRRTPWLKPLKEPKRKPVAPRPETLDRLYYAAAVAEKPLLDGIRPEAWWRGLMVAAYTTGYRRGALLALRWDWVDLLGRTIRVPAEIDKCGEDRVKPIGQVLVAHLLPIRSRHPLVFAWPHSPSTWYRHWWRIQRAAGVEPRMKWHDLKRSCLTAYATCASPAVTQLMGDHKCLSTTLRFYADASDEAREAVERLPLPPGFRSVI